MASSIRCYLDSMREGPNFCRALGQVVREHREKRHWTREQLAADTGISVAHIRVIEVREGNPSVMVFVSIAAAFGIDADKLLLEVIQRQAYLNDKNQPE